MTIPNLDPINGLWNDVSPSMTYSPYSPAWWATSTVTRIPETAVGWLVAQGWQITGTTTDGDVTYYTLSRQSMQNWMILQNLLDSYTAAYNEGRSHNSIRYTDLVYNWNQLLVATRGTLDILGDVSDGHVSLYLTQIDTLLADLETDVGVLKTELDSIKGNIDAQLSLYISKINAIEADYDTHAATVRALLVGLGTTETARINEQFDNASAKAKQALVNRGLYSSVLWTAVQARVERERTEALSKLADMLAREKVDNEHKLFSESMAMDEAVLGGRVRYVSQNMQKVQLADAKQRLVMALLGARMEKANARLGIRDREEKTMAMQLDVRNNIALGFHAMVERREDTYPDMASVTRLVAGLGDSGGGWISPAG
jgi:hypothetical protein